MPPLHPSSQVLAALERSWEAIRQVTPELPAVILLLGPGGDGRRSPIAGHFIDARWTLPRAGEQGEVMIAGEMLGTSATEIFATLLHEAVHALAHARRVPDTSQNYRYHNGYFARVAGELGLSVRYETGRGWCDTTILPAAAERFASAIQDIEAAQQAAHRMRRIVILPATKGPKEPGTRARVFRVALSCQCPRRITAAPTVLAMGPIVCGMCRATFEAPQAEQTLKKGKQ